ncbi:hypothetical protein [Kingella potus]|uniref:hypothetical protein n=1 Tax=Kingella potus TaxID=265175 RepID=UPI001FD02412|nr:hypothetical protein [Kingella potus]UOP00810.1 hypothetical protein LVJ84_13860 [Kingella potus]
MRGLRRTPYTSIRRNPLCPFSDGLCGFAAQAGHAFFVLQAFCNRVRGLRRTPYTSICFFIYLFHYIP